MTRQSDRDGWQDGLLSAFALLTRFPVPDHEWQGPQSAWAWPIVGVCVGLVAVLVGAAASGLNLPALLVAGLIVATQIVLTGALHEDGLADTADALWGGRDRARRLEIMKDSSIGAYGAVALILSVGLRWAAIVALLDTGGLAASVIATAALSRAAMILPMAALPPARPNGLAASVGRPRFIQALPALGIAMFICLVAMQFVAVALLGMVAIAVIAIIALFRRKIGGYTGDLLGATQQITETAGLVTATALMA